jgi:hypothetical protein
MSIPIRCDASAYASAEAEKLRSTLGWSTSNCGSHPEKVAFLTPAKLVYAIAESDILALTVSVIFAVDLAAVRTKPNPRSRAGPIVMRSGTEKLPTEMLRRSHGSGLH